MKKGERSRKNHNEKPYSEKKKERSLMFTKAGSLKIYFILFSISSLSCFFLIERVINELI